MNIEKPTKEQTDSVFSLNDKRFYFSMVTRLLYSDDIFNESERTFLKEIADLLNLDLSFVNSTLLAPPDIDKLNTQAAEIKSPWVKEILINQLYMASMADKKLAEKEKKIIYAMANSLGIDELYLKRVESFCQNIDWTPIEINATSAILMGGILMACGIVAAPALGGIIGAHALGYSGIVASKAGLALLGGGSIASGGLGMAGGTGVIASILGAVGLRQGYKTSREFTKGLKDFNVSIHKIGKNDIHILFINGFLTEDNDNFKKWERIIGSFPRESFVHEVKWDSENLTKIGKFTVDNLGKGGMWFLLSQAATSATHKATALVAPVVAPLRIASLIANPWHVAMSNSKKAGVLLAEWIETNSGIADKIVLLGHSLGARVILYTLLALRPTTKIRSAFLFGGAADSNSKEWKKAAVHIEEKIHNFYSNKDEVLKKVYKMGTFWTNHPIGLGPLKELNMIENIDVSDKVDGHNYYFQATNLLPSL